MTPEQRIQQHIKRIETEFPRAWRTLDGFRADRGKTLPHWPDWCYLPMAAAYAVVSGGGANRIGMDRIRFVAELTALATWRKTRGIYEFDPDILTSVSSTKLSRQIPVDSLFNLPEWCMYVAVPGGHDLQSFFVWLEWDGNEGLPELRFLLDTEQGLLPLVVHMKRGSLIESIEEMIRESEETARLLGTNAPEIGAAEIAKLAQITEPYTAVALYLCSENADIDPPAGNRPEPVKTKKGLKLFSPNAPTIHRVGRRIMERIRKAEILQAEQSGDRQLPKPHLRRAHWHTFRVGPGRKYSTIKWLLEIPVKGGD